MNVYWVSQAGIAPHPGAELQALLARGMNVIVFDQTQLSQVIGVLSVIAVMMTAMFVWSKRQG